MKRMIVAVLAMCMLFSLAGCGNRNAVQQNPTASTQSTGTTAPTVAKPTTTDPVLQGPLTLGKTGKTRIPYTVNISSVKYITSMNQLPEYEALAEFDEQYFREKALLLIFETVNSGSLQVEIDSVTVEGSNAVVTLSHNTSGMGTDDMAVWMLWAEVPQGLSLQWSISNPAVESGNSKY